MWRYTGIIHLVPGHMSPHAQVSSSHDIKDYIEAIWSGSDEGESGGPLVGNLVEMMTQFYQLFQQDCPSSKNKLQAYIHTI